MSLQFSGFSITYSLRILSLSFLGSKTFMQYILSNMAILNLFHHFFQITYFSLWYYNKQNQRRWVDLDKPLKKQLDKYALEPTVYFGVVFYVPTVSQLQQEITR